MKSDEIKKNFFSFFEKKGHQIVPAAPIVNKDDPTLMFTNAGMNQFKTYFSDISLAQYKRVADIQPCLRVSGKHNDLEDVGMDTYHNTMFEMMGSWSFGDYFKEEAIAYAWELLTVVYGIDKKNIYATTFGGDLQDNLDPDMAAYKLWKNFLPEEQILNNCTKKDNFWEMGDMGPCGPCTELHIDLRSDSEKKLVKGRDLVNRDHPEVVEIWNLVFIQFERLKNSSLVQLEAKSVDTGMGFERLAMVLQDKRSSYDTDVFVPLLDKVSGICGFKYGDNKNVDIAMRVIVDHIRSISFCIADGQLPSNNKAGYVVKRILRRASRYGYSYLGLQEPFLHEMIHVLSEIMGKYYPQIGQNSEYIKNIVHNEEKSFLQTLQIGMERINKIFDLQKNQKTISGKQAFELYDTYGFPIDLTQLIAKENDAKVDIEEFEKELLTQRERSKTDAKKDVGDWHVVNSLVSSTEFVGYDQLEAQVAILKYRSFSSNKAEGYQIVLDKTPFYPQGGGQLGDSGFLIFGNEKIEVVSTKKENDLIIHETVSLPRNIAEQAIAMVNKTVRQAATVHHSATHLLAAALKMVLGKHVEQKGSMVSSTMLRFDFLHTEKISNQELLQIEQIVNKIIRQNIKKTEVRDLPIDDAKKMGATALFGEKYGSKVRLIAFDENFSIELCGGTHVERTGDIGFFKIASVSGVAAGVKRIEAYAGEAAEKYVEAELNKLNKISEIYKYPKDLISSVNNNIEELNTIKKESQHLQSMLIDELSQKAEIVKISPGGVKYCFINLADFSTDAAKNLIKKVCSLHSDVEYVFIVINKNLESIVAVWCSPKRKDLNITAKYIVDKFARQFNAKGGGTDTLAILKAEYTVNIQNIKELIYQII